MYLSIVAAMDENRGIGIENRLPWHLGTDFKLFKARTMGHHLIMGKNTYISLGRPLPGRIHIIVSSVKSMVLPNDCYLVNSLEEGITLAEQHEEAETFVIGGERIFNQALPRADRMYLTRVHAVCRVDAYFPVVQWEQWQKEDSENYTADDVNDYDFSVEYWIRKVV